MPASTENNHSKDFLSFVLRGSHCHRAVGGAAMRLPILPRSACPGKSGRVHRGITHLGEIKAELGHKVAMV
ncbi:hypothetical protein AB0M48_05555 [Lentzea sp. NPDC051208]|uniref:hypothetical protein n=1 Tax=Lentzea sp. NPDC051208 TaxID=3154642 RepID=UPI00341F4A4E